MAVVLALAGGVGALARAELGGHFGPRRGTAVVNLLGAALLGLLVGLDGGGGGPWLRVLGTGFCGGFTTFSTWMVEAGREQVPSERAVAVAAPLVVGVAVAVAARALAG